MSLMLAEAIAALHALKPGGSFVLKVFSLLESQSMCLVYLLRQSFFHLSIFKPTSSKSGNNELYLVCKGYLPDSLASDAVDLLKSEMRSPTRLEYLLQTSAIVSLHSIPLSFVIDFESAVSMFTHWQKEAIETNLKLHEANVMNSCCRKEVTALKKQRSRVYLKKFPVLPLPPHARLVKPVMDENSAGMVHCPSHPS